MVGSPTRRPRIVWGSALLIVFTACSGAESSTPESSTPDPSTPSSVPVEDDASAIVGHWKDGRGATFQFREDGSYDVNEGKYEVGTYEFDDGTLTLSGSEDSTYCTGTVAEYRITFSAEGDLADPEVVDDPCTLRRTSLQNGGPMERLDP